MSGELRDVYGVPIPKSDLILNEDGTIFHLHLRPEHMARTVVLVGDPGRVSLVGEHLEGAEEVACSREFRAIRGVYHGEPVLVQSTGIGAGNIDIVLNELDALANVDFVSRCCYRAPSRLTFVRIGTSGALRQAIRTGEAVITRMAVGFDSIPWLYRDGPSVFDHEATRAFSSVFSLRGGALGCVYAVRSAERLVRMLSPLGATGITLCCPGFYGPQQRKLRICGVGVPLIETARDVRYNGDQVLNMEMESGPLNVLSALLGHEAVTVTLAIDNRQEETVKVNYQAAMDTLVERVLNAVLPSSVSLGM